MSKDIAAPESTSALKHLPAWTVMVGQSVMHATVIISAEATLSICGVHY